MKKLFTILLSVMCLWVFAETSVTVGRTSIHVNADFGGASVTAKLTSTAGSLVKSWKFNSLAGTSKIILTGFPKTTVDTPVKYNLVVTKNLDTIVKKTIEVKRIQTQESFTCNNYGTGLSFTFKYLLAYPEYWYHDKSIKAPILFTFHGNGQKGSNINLLRSTYIPQKIDGGMQIGFIVVSPQTNGSMPRWSVKSWYNELLDSLFAKGIDTSEVYISGYSGGGEGVYTYAQDHKVLGVVTFAPVMNSYASIPNVCIFKDARIWGYHCLNDASIGVNVTKNLIANVKKCPNAKPVKMTLYQTGGHFPFAQAFATDSVFKFLKGEL